MAAKDSYNKKPAQKKSTAEQKIPSISLDSDDTIKDVVSSKMPSISMGSPDDDEPQESAQKERVTMPTSSTKRPAKKSGGSGQRKVADISEMAKKKDPNDIPGVDMRESLQNDILKEGGPFDKYVENKKAEYYERMAYEDEKRKLESFDGDPGEETIVEDLEDTEIDDEEAEILADQGKAAKANTIVVNAVIDDEEDYSDTTDTEEVDDDEYDFDADVEEYEVEDDSTEESDESEQNNEDPKPFYTTMGYEDDYKYPEEYDLPEDEEDDEEVVEEDETETTEEEEEAEELIEEDEEIEEELVEEAEEKEEAPTADPNEAADDGTGHAKIGSTKIAFTLDEESIDDLEKEVENDNDLPTEDERLEELKAEITVKIKPKAQAMNLSGFTIATKTTASNKILDIKETSAGKWVLPTTGITFQVREVSGQKVEYLRENVSTNTPTAARNALKVIYDHIITPKPASFEQWTKSIAYADYDHLFMGIYLAAFSNSNYMPMTCVMESGKIAKKETGCGKMFLSDNIDIMKMVKFKDDDAKKKFWDLYNSDRTNSEGLYASEIVPVSDHFAMAFCEPTLYSVLLENNSYGRDFSDKYENVIAFMPYISNIYWIDAPRHTLVPVDYQKYDNNASKTAKSKVIRYSNVFDTFSTDEYSNIVTIVNGINDQSDWFSYVIPEMTCPECGRTIPEEEMSASGLVFTRHRLGILANTSIK